MRHGSRTLGPCTVFLALLAPAFAEAREIHVESDAAPGGDGSKAAPLGSVHAAVALAAPGDEVIVHEGTYALTEPVLLDVVATEQAPVVLRGEGQVILRDEGRVLPDWTGLVQVEGAAWVTVRGLRVEGAGFFGIMVESSEHVVLEDVASELSDGSGIYVGRSRDVTVRRAEVSRCCEADAEATSAQECVSIVNTDGFEVTEVEVFDSLRGETGGEGIDVKEGSKNGSVHDCLVHDVVRLGIYVDAWDKLTENIEVYKNEIYHSYAGIVVASEAGGLVRNVRVHDNLIWEVGRQFSPASPYWTYDGGTGISVPGYEGNGPRQDIHIFNNTIVGCAGTPEWGLGIEVSTDNVTDLFIRNNVVVGSAASQIDVDSAATVVVENNLVSPYYGHAWTHEVRGEAAVEADPQFVDPEAHDFRLAEGSPARDAGTDATPLAALDFDGRVRVAGAAVDLGAFEFGSAPPDSPDGGGGPDLGEDGAAEADAGGGCGCRMAGAPRGHFGVALLLLAPILYRRRRGTAR